jgi:hypothetical protein
VDITGACCFLAGGKQDVPKEKKIMILQPVLIDEQEASILPRMKVIESLAKFRQEWQSLADDQNLLNVQASVGLILVDITDRLELNEQEKTVVLGHKLITQAGTLLDQTVRVKPS